jgi:hypothetical protein
VRLTGVLGLEVLRAVRPAGGGPLTKHRKDSGYCPKCGVEYEPLQEYCLECGDRLPANRGPLGVLAAAWQRRIPWYPGDWIWPALLFVGIAAVASAISTATTSNAGTTIVATQPNVTLGPGTHSETTAATPSTTEVSTPRPTVTTGPLPKAPGAPSAGASTTPPPPAGLTAWPPNETAYTDVLESLPLSAGRPAAVAKARRAKAAGLPRAGFLVSSTFPSLHPGYYVVFSGIYSTPAQAAAGLADAHAHGFPDAYVGRVTHG